MSYKNIEKKRFLYKIHFKSCKLTVRKKTGLIRDKLENTGQNASCVSFVGTTGHKAEIWDNPVSYGMYGHPQYSIKIDSYLNNINNVLVRLTVKTYYHKEMYFTTCIKVKNNVMDVTRM